MSGKKQKELPGRFPGNRENLYGLHPVTEALRAGRRKFYSLHLAGPENTRFERILDLASKLSIPVKMASLEQLDSMSGGAVHQGVVLACSPFVFADLDSFFKKENSLLLVADGIEDPGNLGAIARTALCLGVSGLVIPRDRSAAPTPAAVKSSAGALEHLPVFQVVNISRTLENLKEEGFWIAALDSEGSAMASLVLDGPLVLVVGGEDRGVRPLVRKTCDMTLSIPQQGPVTSLNASVAAAIAIYEIQRTRLGSS